METTFFQQLDIFHVYTIIFIILSISLLYHVFVYNEIVPDEKAECKHGKEKNYMDYINTAHSGLIRGLIFGIILGDLGIYTGVKNAAIYGVINPIFLYLGY